MLLVVWVEVVYFVLVVILVIVLVKMCWLLCVVV